MSLPLEGKARLQTEDARGIARVIETFVVAFSRGDVDSIRPLFTADAVVYPSNDRARIGWDDIAAYWAPPFASMEIALQVQLIDVFVDGDLAVAEMTTNARVRPRSGGEEVGRRYRDMVVLLRTPTGWRIHRNLSQAHPEVANG
jgi:uncharacterized protein (TIGR02246 family)